MAWNIPTEILLLSSKVHPTFTELFSSGFSLKLLPYHQRTEKNNYGEVKNICFRIGPSDDIRNECRSRFRANCRGSLQIDRICQSSHRIERAGFHRCSWRSCVRRLRRRPPAGRLRRSEQPNRGIQDGRERSPHVHGARPQRWFESRSCDEQTLGPPK